ncbi:MAG: class I SAM-dependent methyltransferase [Pelagibacterium sp.]|jgi:SAM-dependent methyltransferase|uniref:class I SAM-dependent methyltransferase n=1 Tax=Pelagibacterium sp. TaxID=1967288 RepID=UPI0032EC8646
MTNANDQGSKWRAGSGHAWVDMQELLDDLFRPMEDMLVARLPEGQELRLLDIGCGTGATTLAAARRLGSGARCVGADISPPMIAAARERDKPGPEFVVADAQTHAFAPDSFDVLISRFGVMFFPDSVAAFANLRRASRPGARLHALAWRSKAENPFMTTAERAAAALLPDLPLRGPDEPGQFAFADTEKVDQILRASGWSDIAITPVDVVCAMPENELVPYFTRLGPVGMALQEIEEPLGTEVIAAVRPAFDPFIDGDTVRFTAACWMIEASNCMK